MTFHPPENRAERGSTLLAVFWILSVLGFAVFTGVTLVVQEVDIQTSYSQAFHAGLLADEGLAIGAHPLVKRWDPILHQTDGEGGRFDVTITRENARFGLNGILARGDTELLRQIFYQIGLDPANSAGLTDAMLDWVDQDDLEQINGAESDHYFRLGYGNRPFNRPFESMDEVRLVAGMDLIEELGPGWRNLFTLWSGTGLLNINEASAELISMACGCSIESAQYFVEQRRGADGIDHTEDDVTFTNIESVLPILGLGTASAEVFQQRLTVEGKFFRVESLAQSGDYLLRRTAVIKRAGAAVSFLHWEENILLKKIVN